MSEAKYGFVYIWYDRKHKRYYVGSHWGREDDGYVCSSSWMMQAYRIRPNDFRRKIIARIYTTRTDLLAEENRWLQMIKQSEMASFYSKTDERRKHVRYYNMNNGTWDYWHTDDQKRKEVSKKISAAKKGKKTGPRDPAVGRAISAAKKGKPLTDAHKEALRGIKKPAHTDEWKAENSERMHRQWSDGTRRKAKNK